jgi:hypothetical protein
MTPAPPSRISGKKLILTGGLVLIVIAAGARIFARYYLRDMRNPLPETTQPATMPDWH